MKDDSNKIINKAFKTLSQQRNMIANSVEYKRKNTDCLGCFKHDKINIRGEEILIKDYKTQFVVKLQCPRCEKNWEIIIFKDKGWKTKFLDHNKRYKKFQKGRDNFVHALK